MAAHWSVWILGQVCCSRTGWAGGGDQVRLIRHDVRGTREAVAACRGLQQSTFTAQQTFAGLLTFLPPVVVVAATSSLWEFYCCCLKIASEIHCHDYSGRVKGQRSRSLWPHVNISETPGRNFITEYESSTDWLAETFILVLTVCGIHPVLC